MSMTAFCDLHMHSCLSPCGDDDMTPCNIANMAKLKGLQCIALTDHNSCGNCRSTAIAAGRIGLGFIAGMEINTSEDIHAVCLFPDCDSAEAFSDYVYSLLPPVKNKPEIFGKQQYLDENDKLLGTEEKLLITAANLSINHLEAAVKEYNGLCFPAHIDKSSSSVLAVLGDIPPECSFTYAELSPNYSGSPAVNGCLFAHGLIALRNSDAHYLWDISEANAPTQINNDSLGRLITSAIEKATKK